MVSCHAQSGIFDRFILMHKEKKQKNWNVVNAEFCMSDFYCQEFIAA